MLAAACSSEVTPGDAGSTPIVLPNEVKVLHLEPDLRIGATDGDLYFFSVQDIAVDDDGSMYVSDRADDNVRVFDRAGNLVRRIGRKGKGPGEFIAPKQLAITGDTLFVADNGGVLDVFDLHGGFLNVVRVGAALDFATRMYHTPAGIALIGQFDSVNGGWFISRDTLSLRMLDYRTGTVSRPFWRLPLPELRDVGNGVLMPAVGAPFPSIAASADGRIFGNTGEAYTIEVRSAGGIAHERANVVVPRIRVSQIDVDMAKELLARGAQRRGASRKLQSPGKMQFRATLGEMIADLRGNLLVERRDLRQDSMRVWDLIGSEWQVLGRLETSPSLRIRRFRDCELYSAITDSLAVESLVRHRIDPCPVRS